MLEVGGVRGRLEAVRPSRGGRGAALVQNALLFERVVHLELPRVHEGVGAALHILKKEP